MLIGLVTEISKGLSIGTKSFNVGSCAIKDKIHNYILNKLSILL